MSQAVAKRTSLLVGCGSAALALGLLLGGAPAQAQGIQAGGNVTFGDANINQAVPGQTRVRVRTPTTVIDWTPQEDAAGNALDFLPANAFAYYENDSSASFVANFAVLNRILPATNGNVAVINGSVISRIVQFSGSSAPGGFVAFYSPTGILVGGNAFFDVGQLMLTTLDTTPASFDQFAQNGFGLQLQGAQGSTARIRIQPGARIQALPENAFFAVVAADVEMRGIARVNGSHAYVAGEAVNLSLDNGLFTIQVPVGTAAAGEVLTLDGTIGGPSSQGIGDNHLIYAVARAAQDPISMLFRGNLGFDPAQSAGVINGEIIISANHNVFGRTVDGGSISFGAGAVFGANSALSGVRADIDITDANVTGSMLAIGTHRVTAAAVGANSSFLGNLLLVGRESANLVASGGNNITIAGDVLVDAQDYGVSGSGLQSLDVLNATAGTALIEANTGSTIAVAGSALVLANAFAGTETIGRITGSARGGNAAISGNGGLVDIDGAALISARALGSPFFDISTGAEARAGTAEARARAGGTVSIGLGLDVLADAVAAQGSLVNPATVSNAFGGNARIAVLDGGGTITVGAGTLLNASASGGSANATGAGSIGDAGEATVSILDSGQITLGGGLQLAAVGLGGANAGGTGGQGFGGRATVVTQNGGTIEITGDFSADASGAGGAGQTGGNGLAGLAGAHARIGRIGIGGNVNILANGQGGSAEFGFGGDGGVGRGGRIFLQAEGSATQTATLAITGSATLFADGFGGTGGGSDGQAFGPGRGGNGFGADGGAPNQADPNLNDGIYVLAGGDNGTLTVNGVTASATGTGGRGGSGAGLFTGGAGGNGLGGLAGIGLSLFGQTGALGNGQASLGAVNVTANGVGGRSGTDGNDRSNGIGGNGIGGNVALTLRAGDVTATTINLNANGIGGEGAAAGNGTGGEAAVLGSLGGALVANALTISANGLGGQADIGTGGAGTGGRGGVEVDGTRITLNGDLLVEASGTGGRSADGAAGNGLGGEAFVGQVQSGSAGTLNITGHTAIFANGRGGDSDGNFAAGNGQGGHAWVRASDGASTSFGSVQLVAIGRGGRTQAHEGGDGTGGLVELIATGIGSRINIASNMPARFATDSPGGSAILNASGFGEETFGGDGIGGVGRGGTILVSAASGGAVSMPVNITADPASAEPFLVMLANGTGGGSNVDAGVGGAAFGGQLTVRAEGTDSRITMGDANLQAAGLAGSGLNLGVNTQGGEARGGQMRVSATDSASLTFGVLNTLSRARGGDGTGTGNGGVARSGSNVVTLDNATLAVTGVLGIFEEAQGGNGFVGGDAIGPGEGVASAFSATDATIIQTPDGQGLAGIEIESAAFGGGGVTGGNASAGAVAFTLVNTDLGQGILRIASFAGGGGTTSTNGTGGNAFSRPVSVSIADSTLFLSELVVASDAFGGQGGGEAGGLGGEGVAGTASLVLTDSALTVQPVTATGTESMRVTAQGNGGQGFTTGNATGGRATLRLTGSSVDTAQLRVSGEAFAAGTGGQTGGAAVGGQALIEVESVSDLTAAVITVDSSASSSAGGSTTGGLSTLRMGSGTGSSIDAGSIFVAANAFGASQTLLADTAGRFEVALAGGNVNAGNFFAGANGSLVSLGAAASRISAVGGSLNVTGQLVARALGDITLEHGSGGIIGSSAPAQVATTILIDTAGTLRVQGIVPGGGGSTSANAPTGGGLQSFNGATGGIRGQNVDFLAGRSILIDGSIAGTDGTISLLANRGGLPQFPPAPSVITMAQGTLIDGGTGSVSITLLDGLSDPQRQTGAITLANIRAGDISVTNRGSTAGSDIIVRADGVLRASGTLRAISLASLGGEVINLHGDAGLVLTGGGHYGIYAATPTGSQIGSPANYQRRYNVQTEQSYNDADPGSNYAAFRITPVLSITADNIARFYGSANPAFTASITGFLPGDSIADLTGALQFLTGANGTSPVGQYALNVAQGTLVSAQGYQFTFAPGILNVTPRPITITASNFSRVYGNANPALTFTVGGQGLVNGDQLTGALATTAGLTTGIGNYAITQGSLAASNNYAVTFVAGQLTITPRPITITAESFSRIYGNANPALTFTLGGLGLVNGDQLTGALATSAGVTTGVGTAAITQGTLTAGANYAVTFNPGVLTITPRPLSITAASLSRVYGNANPTLTFTLGGQGLVNGDQLTGALAAAGVTAGVGTSPITIGTLTAGANYAVTFTPGVLTITPRPLTVAANKLSKTFGLADPLLTFLITSGDLVNGDQLSGSLVRDPGETIASFVIRQGTLSAGDNYALTFVPGTFTINPPPVSPDLYNPTTFEPALVIGDTLPPVAGEVQDRFGIDFPERPEAALISEDPLLDDPVASGGDSSVYGGAANPAGGK